MTIRETVPASRKFGRDEARELAEAASRIIVCKGKKVSEFRPQGEPDDEIVEAMLGPTGNLRAPTIRAGKPVLVGFNVEPYTAVFG